MKKKLFALLFAPSVAFMLTACGGSGNGGDLEVVSNVLDEMETVDETADETQETPENEPSGNSGESIRLANGKVEVDKQLKELARMYQEETGVAVEIETIPDGVNVQDTIKGYYRDGNMPDIFVNGGSADFANWEGLVEDMSDQPWVYDTDAGYKDETGAVIGFPYTVEAIGLAYNADILEKAGIEPSSLTSPKAIQEAFEELDEKKEDLGMKAVVGYCAEPVNMYWSTGDHVFANYIDSGLDREDTTYIDLLNDGGKFDQKRLEHFAAFIGMLNQYSDPDLLVAGTYDQQVFNFASGKYAFVTQGSWIGATLANADEDAYKDAGSFKCGMIPYAFEDGIDTILTNSPSFWAVYKDGNTKEAKAFLQWLTTDRAQKILVEEAGFVSPFQSCTYIASDPFAETIANYTAAQKTSAWHWLSKKEGMAQHVLGQIFNDFASGALDEEGFVSAIQSEVANYYKEE